MEVTSVSVPMSCLSSALSELRNQVVEFWEPSSLLWIPQGWQTVGPVHVCIGSLWICLATPLSKGLLSPSSSLTSRCLPDISRLTSPVHLASQSASPLAQQSLPAEVEGHCLLFIKSCELGTLCPKSPIPQYSSLSFQDHV